MKILQKYAVFAQLLLGIFVLISSGTASADPTTNVARISYIDGTVTYSPSGVNDWVYAKLNHPVVAGDRLWADVNGRAELQLGPATVRLWSNTYLTLLNFNNQIAQFQLNQGSINFHIYKTKINQAYEIDTPNLAFTAYKSGDYRVDVSPDGKTTTVSIRGGQGTVYDSKSVAYPVSAQQSYIYTGTDLSHYKSSSLRSPDGFDQWCSSRQMRVHKAHKSVSTKYVSPDMIGSEDFDNYGTWQNNDSYGNVWIPNQVEPGWAPYSDGSWVWIDQYGWTWVDNAPWGFAPFHYGRWVYFEDHWAWVPGPVYQPPVYAPALVVFFFGDGFPGVGWFPLGYGDIYIPPYYTSSNYFNQINVSNTVINNTIINNYYNNPNQVINYSNKLAPNAVTAMPVNSFVNSKPVAKGLVTIPKDIAKIPVKPIAPLAPTMDSVSGGGKPAKVKPSPKVLNRPVIAKTTPPPIVPFDAKLAKLNKNPGVPLAPEKVIPKTMPTTIVIPHPPGVMVKPHGHNIEPSPQTVTKPDVVPSAGLAPHSSEIKPQQQNIQPHVQEQQMQNIQQQRLQEEQHARQMEQQRAQEQQVQQQQRMQQQAHPNIEVQPMQPMKHD